MLLREVALENLDKFKGNFPVPEISRDTLVEWGEYKGFGIRTTFEDKGGRQYQFMVFGFSDKDQSMVIKEFGSKKALESLAANMGFIRKSLKLTSSCREDSEKPILNLDSSGKAKLDSLFGVRKERNDKP